MINKIVDGISKAINKEFGNNYEIYSPLKRCKHKW